MSRVIEAWSPENVDIILTRQSDADLVKRAFECAIAEGSDASKELYDRRLSYQFDAKKPSRLWFDDGETPVVVGALAAYARKLPETKRNLPARSKAQSLIGAVAIAARYEYALI